MSIIWVGIGVDEQLQSVRELIAAVEERLALSDPCQRARIPGDHCLGPHAAGYEAMLGEPLPDTLLAHQTHILKESLFRHEQRLK